MSLVLHVVLFFWLTLHRQITSPPEGIVEITWLEPAPLPAPPALATPQAETTEAVPPSPTVAKPERKFQRQRKQADVAPKPQDREANRDRLKERLAALKLSSPPTRVHSAAPTTSSNLLKSTPAAVDVAGAAKEPLHLKRESSRRSAPLDLKRGEPVRSSNPRPATATIKREVPAAAAPIPAVETAARNILNGVSLAGPVADRPVVAHYMPSYPDWAKSEAVEASVTIFFVVLPDGRVKENVQVQKTAGFIDFDQNAIDALLKWRFEPLAGGTAQEQWGTITFRYRLRDVQ